MGRPAPAARRPGGGARRVSDAELLQAAEEAARAAAEVLLAYRRGGGAGVVHAKSTPTDLVSQADLDAERAIRAVLTRLRPDDAILGEEGDDVAGTSGLRWVVDPLDGTINYLFGIPQWCVSIACEGHVAVILDPARPECFRAVAGGGATLDGAALRASQADDLATALIATGFGYDAAVRRAQAEQVATLLPQVRDIRRMGSAALDLAWTAAGRYDAYYERGVQHWDVAAGLLLCAEAGLECRELEPRGALPAGVLVAPAGIADPLQAVVG